MIISCRAASLLCGAAFLLVESLPLVGLGLAHTWLSGALRLLLAYIWARCWSRTQGTFNNSGGAPRCGPVAAQPWAVAPHPNGGDTGPAPTKRSATWRSAGVPLPDPALTMNLIKSRRSVFCKDMSPPGGTGADVDAATLRTLLEAASWAPSHGRTDPWHFVVFNSQQGLSQLAQLSVALIRRHEGEGAARVAAEEFEPGKRWANAAALIAICMRRMPRWAGCGRGTAPAVQAQYNPEWEEVAAVACAVQNLHLMATAMPGGLGGYWSSWYECVRDSPELHHLLGLEQGDRCLGFFVLGRCQRVGEIRATRGPVSVDWR